MLKLSTIRNIADVEAEKTEQAAEQSFRAARAEAIETATVNVGGNIYNANERSIQRMASTLIAMQSWPDDSALSWSMADTPSGIMTPITKSDLAAAHRAAVLNMAAIWGR